MFPSHLFIFLHFTEKTTHKERSFLYKISESDWKTICLQCVWSWLQWGWKNANSPNQVPQLSRTPIFGFYFHAEWSSLKGANLHLQHSLLFSSLTTWGSGEWGGVLDTNFLLVLPRAAANIGEWLRERQDSSYFTCLLQYLHGNTCVWMPNKPFSEISLIPLSFLVPSALGETMIISWNIWRITLNHRKPMQKKISKTNYLCPRYIFIWEKEQNKIIAKFFMLCTQKW